MRIGQHGQVRGLIKRVFDAANDERAIRVGHIEDHHSHSVIALAAQRFGKDVRMIAELLGRLLNPRLGVRGNVTGQRSVVEYDGNGGRGESAFLGHVANRDGGLGFPGFCVGHWETVLRADYKHFLIFH